jgi:KDO2-lipid IV(A) lauroyltransferase
MYFFLKIYSFILRLSPQFIVKFNEYFIYSLLFHFIKIRRELVDKNLSIAFPTLSAKERYLISKKCYKFFSKEMIDLIKGSFWKDTSMVKFENIQELEKALELNKGVLLVGGHLGAFDKAFASIKKKGHKISGVAYEQNNKGSDRYFKNIRENFFTKQLYRGDNLKEILHLLKKNEIVVLLSDQNARHKGIDVNFFGYPCSTFSGAAVLHKRTGAPILFFDIIKQNQEYWTSFKKINEENNRDIASVVQEYTFAIEKSIKKDPSQYFWFHNRWRV